MQEFDDLSPGELTMLFEKDVKSKQEEVTIAFRSQCEVMRIQTMYLVNIQVQKKHQQWETNKFMPFTWDDKKVKKQSMEEMKQIMLGIANVQNKRVDKDKLKPKK